VIDVNHPLSRFAARFASDRSAVASARRAVVDFARAAGFSGEELWDIESAVGEALANAVEHGHSVGATVEVRCAMRGNALVIEVKDEGTGFARRRNHGLLKASGSYERGYGIYIIKSLMDDVSYSEQGTRVKLVKRRAGDRRNP
jgi:serine/threonine-protein kinase RsbW